MAARFHNNRRAMARLLEHLLTLTLIIADAGRWRAGRMAREGGR